MEGLVEVGKGGTALGVGELLAFMVDSVGVCCARPTVGVPFTVGVGRALLVVGVAPLERSSLTIEGEAKPKEEDELNIKRGRESEKEKG